MKNINEMIETEEVEEKMKEVSEWGTFKDSLKAPVFGWFTYPAGFSFKAVENSLSKENLQKGISVIYDPFMGSGTTNLVAKLMGYNSIGVEAHPFVFPITIAKMNWEVNLSEVDEEVALLRKKIANKKLPKNLIADLTKEFPELILKCFLPETLYELRTIRDTIKNSDTSEETKLFLNVALICSLRDVSIAATGWPYISPKKVKVTSMSKNGADVYFKRVMKMTQDIIKIKSMSSLESSQHSLILGDSRNTEDNILSESVDHIFTSPPYLNNFDYADRTRLEMYFMGDANTWGDISAKIRTKLITSATTQISRLDKKYNFTEDFKQDCPEVVNKLSASVKQLGELRLLKGGKKSYDLLTVGYFNDLYKILKENFRVLKKGKKARYILGDSAPYGVHIPTDEIIGEIGKCVGFDSYDIEILRVRGGKWAKNPQRHSVALRETIVTLYK